MKSLLILLLGTWAMTASVAAAPVMLVMKDGRQLRSDTETLKDGMMKAFEDGVLISVQRNEVERFVFPPSHSSAHVPAGLGSEDLAVPQASDEQILAAFSADLLHWISPETTEEIRHTLKGSPSLVSLLQEGITVGKVRELLSQADAKRVYEMMREDILYHFRQDMDVIGFAVRCNLIYQKIEHGQLALNELGEFNAVLDYLQSLCPEVSKGLTRMEVLERKFSVVPHLHLASSGDLYDVSVLDRGSYSVTLKHRSGESVVRWNELSPSTVAAFKRFSKDHPSWKEFPEKVFERDFFEDDNPLLADIKPWAEMFHAVSDYVIEHRPERKISVGAMSGAITSSDRAKRQRLAITSMLSMHYRSILSHEPTMSPAELDWVVLHGSTVLQALAMVDDSKTDLVNYLPSRLLKGSGQNG